MNPSFSVQRILGLPIVVYNPWWERQIVHGTTTAQLDFSDETLEVSVAGLAEAFPLSKLFLPVQNHGNQVLRIGENERLRGVQEEGLLDRRSVADAVVATFSDGGPSCAIGVRTADCVPILIEASNKGASKRSVWAVIHAGWRGLACGVIGEAINALREVSEPVQAAIFPCAGGGEYEVGAEVLVAIGASAVAVDVGNGKHLLNLGETAVAQLSSFLPQERISNSGLCTISSTLSLPSGGTTPLFHSFRREKKQSGRSVTFVIP